MCQIYGVNMSEGINISPFLKCFFAGSDKYRHGWGYADLSGKVPVIQREPTQGTLSALLTEKLSAPVIMSNAFAHMRYATVGGVTEDNCHPFFRADRFGGVWTFMHQGTVFTDCHNQYRAVQKGTTDSERILYALVEQINETDGIILRSKKKSTFCSDRRLLTSENFEGINEEVFAREYKSMSERIETVEKFILSIADGNKLVLAIYDGELLYLHCNYRDFLYIVEYKTGIMFCTVPLIDGDWMPIELNTMFVYKNGTLIYRGTTHEYEYFDTERDLLLLSRDPYAD